MPRWSLVAVFLLSSVCLAIYSNLNSRLDADQRVANLLEQELTGFSHRRTLSKVYADDFSRLNLSGISPEKQRIGWLEAIRDACSRTAIDDPRVTFYDSSVLESANDESSSAGLFSSIEVTETPVRLLVSPRHEVHLAELLAVLTEAPDMLIEQRGCDVNMTVVGIDADCRFSLYSIRSGPVSGVDRRVERSDAGIPL